MLARDHRPVVAADGTGAERYLGTTDTGRCYDRTLTAAHGVLTSDVRRHCVLPPAAGAP
jgi:hypothetical protein